MQNKKRQKLTLCLECISKDFFGVFKIDALVNGKTYTFHTSSEYSVRKVEELIKKRRPGKALNLLKLFNLKEYKCQV